MSTTEHAAPAEAASPPAAASLEALLVTSERPIAPARLAATLELVDDAAPARDAEAAIEPLVAELNAAYESTGRSFRVERVAGGLRLMTLPAFAEVIARSRGVAAQAKLSRAAIETLAIIAYRQPTTRADVEAIRGVGCGEVLRGLLERRLIAITGRAEELGRPMLYGTTTRFLETFGLGSIKDLPPIEEGLPDLAALAAAPEAEPEPEPARADGEADA